MWGIVLVISTMPHFITTHSINNPNYIKMQQNKNQQLDAKFRKFIKVLIIMLIHHLCMTDDLIAYKTYQEY